jgi:hypothetical protein
VTPSSRSELQPLVDSIERLIRLHEFEAASRVGDVEAAAAQSRPWPRLRHWIASNIPWVVGVIAVSALAGLQLRDQWRDQLREGEEFQREAEASIAAQEQNLSSHIDQADRRSDELEDAIVETQVTTVEAMEQIRKEIRVVHPRLEETAPEVSPVLRKAQDQARESAARRDLFTDK